MWQQSFTFDFRGFNVTQRESAGDQYSEDLLEYGQQVTTTNEVKSGLNTKYGEARVLSKEFKGNLLERGVTRAKFTLTYRFIHIYVLQKNQNKPDLNIHSSCNEFMFSVKR
jgi:hypothetical protein